MSTNSHPEVVPSEQRSELQQFALWFHQDWKLVYPDFYSGLKLYLSSLTDVRRATLGLELHQFLAEHANDSDAKLKQHWLRLGAEAWQSNLKIRDTLETFDRIILSKTKDTPAA